MKKTLLAFLAFVLFFSVDYLGAQDEEYEAKTTGLSIGGEFSSFIVNGNYAYLTSGDKILVLDLSAEDITNVSSFKTSGFTSANNFVIYGDKLYAAGSSGFDIFDVSDPSNPDSIGHFHYYKEYIAKGKGKFDANNEIVVFSSHKELKIYDVSDLSDISEIYAGGDEYEANAVALDDDYLYVLNEGAQIFVFNISDPAAPVKVAESAEIDCGSDSRFHRLVRAGDALIAGGHRDKGVYVLDISNPESLGAPVHIHEKNYRATHLFADGSSVAVMEDIEDENDPVISIYDVSSPSNPTKTNTFEWSSFLIGLEGIGLTSEKLYVYVKPDKDIFREYDLSDLSDVDEYRGFSYPQSISSIAPSGDYLFLSSWGNIYILDKSDFENPVLHGPADVEGVMLHASDDLLFCIQDMSGDIGIYDISNPLEITELSDIKTGMINDAYFAYEDNILYSGLNPGGNKADFLIYDLTNPESPQSLSELETDYAVRDMIIPEGSSYLYIIGSNRDGQFLIPYDVSDLTSPVEGDRIVMPGEYSDVMDIELISENTLCVATRDGSESWITFFDISQETPSQVHEHHEEEGAIWAVKSAGKYLVASFHYHFDGIKFYEINESAGTGKIELDEIQGDAFIQFIADLTAGSTTELTASEGDGYVVSGYCIRKESSTVENSYKNSIGGVDDIFIPIPKPKKPTLTLGVKNKPRQFCLCEATKMEVPIAEISLTADEVSDWSANSIKFSFTGSSDVDTIILRQGHPPNLQEQRISISKFTGHPSEEFFNMSIGKTINRGETLNMTLLYSFRNWSQCKDFFDVPIYNTTTKVAWVGATPNNPEYSDSYKKEPQDKTFQSGKVQLYCVEVVPENSRPQYFINISEAAKVEGPATMNICSGEYDKFPARIGNNIKIQGAQGKDNTVIKAKHVNNLLFIFDYVYNTEISDLTISSNETAIYIKESEVKATNIIFNGLEKAFTIHHGDNDVLIENCEFNECSETAIYITGCDDNDMYEQILINNNVFNKCEEAIGAFRSEDFRVSNNEFNYELDEGFGMPEEKCDIFDCKRFVVADNTFNTTRIPLKIANSKDFRINDNTFHHCANVINSSRNENYEMKGNRFVLSPDIEVSAHLFEIYGTKEYGIIKGSYVNPEHRFEEDKLLHYGIVLEKCQGVVIKENYISDCFIGLDLKKNSKRNIIKHNEITKNQQGITLHQSDYNFFKYNEIHDNYKRGMIEVESDNNVWEGNEWYGNGDDSWFSIDSDKNEKLAENDSSGGIILKNSSSIFKNNDIRGNEPSGIICLEGSQPTISENNIHENEEYGLDNRDETVSVEANNNWWGDPTGPSGEGGGSGDKVSSNVNFGDFSAEPFYICVSAETEEVYIPVGMTARVEFSAKKFFDGSAGITKDETVESDDEINVTISDELQWLGENTEFTLDMSDTTVTAPSQTFTLTTPADISNETTNSVVLDGVSSINNEWTDSDTLKAIAYAPELAELIIWPDTVEIIPGGSYQFTPYGLDQHNKEIELSGGLQWTAEEGDIDEDGVYTPPGTPGTYRIAGSLEGKEAEAYAVVVDTTVSVEEEIVVGKVHEAEVFPNPSRGSVNLRFAAEINSAIQLIVSDALGNKVIDKELPTAGEAEYHYELDCSALGSGVYYFLIVNGERQYAGKFLLLK